MCSGIANSVLLVPHSVILRCSAIYIYFFEYSVLGRENIAHVFPCWSLLIYSKKKPLMI